MSRPGKLKFRKKKFDWVFKDLPIRVNGKQSATTSMATFGQTKGLTFRQQDGSVITLDVPAIENGQNWPELKKWIWNRSAGPVRRFLFQKWFLVVLELSRMVKKLKNSNFFKISWFLSIFFSKKDSLSPHIAANDQKCRFPRACVFQGEGVPSKSLVCHST